MEEQTKFNKHEVEWTPEKIKNFWNYFVGNESLLELSFARQNGKEIIEIIGKYLKKDGNNLDYGCGSGALMGHLFEAGVNCQGLDSSDASLQEATEKFGSSRYFKGVVLSEGVPNRAIADNRYDFIFLVETLEHLLPDRTEATLGEIKRILAPGGYLFVTVPNKEKLDRYKVICPDCGCVFHRVQHVNSFSSETLPQLLGKNGLEAVFCSSTFLYNKKGVIGRIKRVVKFISKAMSKEKPFEPHLICLVRKP